MTPPTTMVQPNVITQIPARVTITTTPVQLLPNRQRRIITLIHREGSPVLIAKSRNDFANNNYLTLDSQISYLIFMPIYVGSSPQTLITYITCEWEGEMWAKTLSDSAIIEVYEA